MFHEKAGAVKVREAKQMREAKGMREAKEMARPEICVGG